MSVYSRNRTDFWDTATEFERTDSIPLDNRCYDYNAARHDALLVRRIQQAYNLYTRDETIVITALCILSASSLSLPTSLSRGKLCAAS